METLKVVTIRYYFSDCREQDEPHLLGGSGKAGMN
jgi:hypothetical protein